MPSVLFVCTANRFRSPIAAASFLHHLKNDMAFTEWRVGSAGTWDEPGLPVFPFVTWVKDHFGLDLAEHRAVHIDSELISQYA